MSIVIFRTHAVMTVNITRQIVTDYVPVGGAAVNRRAHYGRTNINRQLCISRAGRDEYHQCRY